MDKSAIVARLSAWLHTVERVMLDLRAERRCAMRLDGIGERLTHMGQRIDTLRGCLHDRAQGLIDPDWELREALGGLKSDIRDLRGQLIGLAGPRLSARLQRAFRDLLAVAELTYASADRLQREISEHDRLQDVLVAD